MAGFDQALARQELKIPEGYELHAMVAIGKLGDKASLDEALQAREVPSPRKPLSELAAEGISACKFWVGSTGHSGKPALRHPL